MLIQSVQRLIHARVIAVDDRDDAAAESPKPPLPVRMMSKLPALGAVAGYAVAIGPLPEHAPAFARRRP